MMQASLKIPSFTKGVSQLSPLDIEKTRKLANLWIHVERVIRAPCNIPHSLVKCLSLTLPPQLSDKNMAIPCGEIAISTLTVLLCLYLLLWQKNWQAF